MINVFAFVSFVILAALCLLFDGWVTTLLWKWFVSPVFGIRTISLYEAVGLGIFIMLAFHQYNDVSFKDKSPKELISTLFSMLFGRQILTLIAGSIVYYMFG